VSLAMAVHWIFNLGIGQLFLPSVTKFGLPSVYIFFAAVCGFTGKFPSFLGCTACQAYGVLKKSRAAVLIIALPPPPTPSAIRPSQPCC